LNSYLSINRNHPKFKCPVCNKDTPFADLVVDPYVERILKEAPPETDEIEIKPDGTWIVPEVRKRRMDSDSDHEDQPSPKRREMDTPKKLKPVEIVDLT